MVRHLFEPNVRNVAALASVSALLLLGHLLVPHWSTRYGAYLTVFSIWMIWFVLTVVEWLGEADAEP